MKILLCSDGTPSSDNAVRLTGLLVGKCEVSLTLLGVAEKSDDEKPLRGALEKETDVLRGFGINPELTVRAGDPMREIVDLTAAEKFDLTIIGTRGHGPSGLSRRSQKTYEAVKTVHSPLLVVAGECEELKRFLICTGGKHFIDDAVQLTGQLAACAGASVTLLHVMAEPPAMYADLVELEEDVDRLLASGSELGENLRAQKEMIEKLGVPAGIRIRHGVVIDELFREMRETRHDLIVTGSPQASGPLRHYIMGNLTRGILNRADCPVLVARSGQPHSFAGFFGSLRRMFGSSRPPVREVPSEKS